LASGTSAANLPPAYIGGWGSKGKGETCSLQGRCSRARCRDWPSGDHCL